MSDEIFNEACREARAEEIKRLRDALVMARIAIKALHGPAQWEIYEKHSPEMREIDAALSSAARE